MKKGVSICFGGAGWEFASPGGSLSLLLAVCGIAYGCRWAAMSLSVMAQTHESDHTFSAVSTMSMMV